MNEQPKIELALIGAGITSLCLAHGLQKNPRLNVQIYEARAEIGEDKTGVGLAAIGQQALSLISPELHACLFSAGAVINEPSVRFMLASTNTHIADVNHNPNQATVVRSRFITEVLKTLPAGIIQTNKRLTQIDETTTTHPDKITLHFTDNTQIHADAIIGCDGVNSRVREHILGASHPSLTAPWSNGFDTRIMIPIAQARAIFGEQYCSLRTQTGHIGANGFCLTDFENDGETMQVIAGFRGDVPTPEIHGKPFAEVDKTFWTRRLRRPEWGWIGERISQVVDAQDGKVYAASGRIWPATPTYVKGRVCVAGDAARSFSPARGSGASIGMEDALALSAALERVTNAAQVGKALEVYNRLRHHRREMVADYSNAGILLITGRDAECGLDVEKLRERIARWNDPIRFYDLRGLQAGCWELMRGP